MAPRVPTILGWAGFDGGYRRAVSFARTLDSRQPDDDPILKPPACPPHSANFEAVYDPFVDCGCYEAISGPILSAQITGTTGLAGGPVTLTWDGSGWSAVIGTATIDFYALAGCTGTVFSSQTCDIILSAFCAVVGSNVVYNASANLDGVTAGDSGLFLSGSGSLGVSLSNTITCDGQHAGILGAVTLALA